MRIRQTLSALLAAAALAAGIGIAQAQDAGGGAGAGNPTTSNPHFEDRVIPAPDRDD